MSGKDFWIVSIAMMLSRQHYLNKEVYGDRAWMHKTLYTSRGRIGHNVDAVT
jgi:hypothetical protein